jgi:hypothetical protein
MLMNLQQLKIHKQQASIALPVLVLVIIPTISGVA